MKTTEIRKKIIQAIPVSRNPSYMAVKLFEKNIDEILKQYVTETGREEYIKGWNNGKQWMRDNEMKT